jgi:hypothetical protein
LQHTWILDDLRDKYNRIEQQKADRKLREGCDFVTGSGNHRVIEDEEHGMDSSLRGRYLQGDRSHRADIDAGLAFIAGAFPLFNNPEETDPCVKAPLGKIHLRTAFLCSANPYASSTQNTPVGIVVHNGVVFHDSGFFEIAFKTFRFQTHAEELGQILKCALLVRRAVSAVHIMNREEQAKGASLQVSHGGSGGLDNQRRKDPDDAGRNGFPLDFDETQPAGSIRMLHAFKITEVRNINTVAQAGFQKNSSLLNFNLFLVYQELDHETLMPLSPWPGAQSPEPGVEGRPF